MNALDKESKPVPQKVYIITIILLIRTMSHRGQVHYTLSLSSTALTLFLGGFVPPDTYGYCLSQPHLPIHITTSFFIVFHHSLWLHMMDPQV